MTALAAALIGFLLGALVASACWLVWAYVQMSK